MKALHLNHNGFFEFCKGYDESKTIKFYHRHCVLYPIVSLLDKTGAFHFFAAPPCTPRRFFKDKEIFGFARSAGRTEASGVCALHTRRLPK